jgi:hypothetical protein
MLGRKKLRFDPQKFKSTLQNRLALRKMPLFDESIKTFVKKCLEEKSFVLTPRV